jgi:hypothetical protein
MLVGRGFVTQRSLLQLRLASVLALSLAILAAGQASASGAAAEAEAEALLGGNAEGGSAPAGAAGAEESATAAEQEELVGQALDAVGLPPRERDETVDAVMSQLLAPVLDEIVVDGTVLPGRVVRLSSKGIVVETDYGAGTIEVPYASIDALETLRNYRVLYGVNDRAYGRLLGIEGGNLLVGTTRSSATRVPLDSIQRGVSDEEYHTRNLTYLRTRFRYWNASLEVGMNIEDGAVEKNKVNIGLGVQRARAPWLFDLDARYAFESQKRADETEPQTTKDEFWGQLRLQYDFWKRAFVYGSVPGEFDIPRGVDSRVYPNAGLGYTLWEGKHMLLDVQGGFGYVNEVFREFGANDYASGVIGFSLQLNLPRDAVIKWWISYFPGLVDPAHNWLFRSEFDLEVPIWDPLALLFRVTEVNDNNPSPEVGNNKVVTTLGFALKF